MRTLPKATFTAAATALGAVAPQPASAMIECGMASWYGLEASEEDEASAAAKKCEN